MNRGNDNDEDGVRITCNQLIDALLGKRIELKIQDLARDNRIVEDQIGVGQDFTRFALGRIAVDLIYRRNVLMEEAIKMKGPQGDNSNQTKINSQVYVELDDDFYELTDELKESFEEGLYYFNDFDDDQNDENVIEVSRVQSGFAEVTDESAG